MGDFWIVDDLEPLARSIDRAKPAPDNTRLHPEENLDTIEDSLRKFGQRKPIVVNNESEYIEAGNALYQVAIEKMGAEEIAMTFVEDSEEDAKTFEIVDNKSQELGGWDLEQLAIEFEKLETKKVKLEMTGFSQGEISGIMDEPDLEPYFEDEEEGNTEDEPELAECPECGHKFEI